MGDYLLQTSLLGKINNLRDFKSEALLPVFEAVANSIQAIEERSDVKEGRIVVRIIRDGQYRLQNTDDHENIVQFEIEDNGVGFDDKNFESFKTAETTHKLWKGCKGVGRFFWLKAFRKVEIESIYTNGDDRRLRKIVFSKDDGIKEVSNEPTTEKQKTVVRLEGFIDEYREQPSAYKTTAKIAQRIFEHCLSYFIGNAAPSIIVTDVEGSFSLQTMYDEIKHGLKTESIDLSGKKFSITHVKLYSTHRQMHNIVLCANNRDVKSFSIAKLLGASAQFDEDNKKFFYSAYVSGDYLNQHVDSSRIDFDLPEGSENIDSLYEKGRVLGVNELRSAVLEKAKEFLSDYLKVLRTKKEDLVRKYVENENPALRSVLKHCPEILDEFELNTSEVKLDEILHKYKGRAEFLIRQRGKEILKTQASSVDEIQDQYKKITEELEDLQKDSLAGYMVFRKLIPNSELELAKHRDFLKNKPKSILSTGNS